jgi:cystathionine gamma-lyase
LDGDDRLTHSRKPTDKAEGARYGPSTLAVHAGLPDGGQGEPLLGGPVLAAPFHLRGPADASPYGYGRDANPSWTGLERALGELEGGASLAFASGMAALTATAMTLLRPGDVLVAVSDGYPGVRLVASERLQPFGVKVRFAPTDTAAVLEAVPGARLLWLETPSNPRLDVVDVAAIAQAAHASGALVAVDNTLATPLGQRPLALGADLSVMSGTKTLCGHSDMLLGAVSARDEALIAAIRRWRSQSGSIPGAFEAWLAHRSLATLALRLERSSAGALAVAHALRERDDVLAVHHPGLEDHPQHAIARRQMAHFGCLVGFTVASAARAQAVLDACELVAEATSFGGVHATAERRGRWGTDDVPEGFIRYSAGCEDPEDLVADLIAALDATRGA